jgi:hypothetical protein
MTVLLTLGGVIFQGFEIPDVIPIGGEQALVVHKLPGGSRVIDAMGADHRDISWSGRFRSTNAESRARILDGYRIGGQQFLLQWSTYRYQVIVHSFEAMYQQPFEIPYSISCTVVTDESAPVLTGIPALDELIGSDLGNALGLSNSLGVAAIGTAMTSAQQAISTVSTLKNAPASSISQILGTLGGAQQAVGATITANTATISAATPVTAGGNPSAMASSLTSQASAFGQLNQLYQLSTTVTRMTKNLDA